MSLKLKIRVALPNRARSVWTLIRGAFNIIRDAFIQHYFHILSMTCI